MAKYNCPVCKAPSTKETGCWKHSSKKPLKKSTLKKKPKTVEQKEENRQEIEKMWDFFNELWAKLPVIKKCWGCKKRIFGENLSVYWDHLIRKTDHPELKYEKDNMFFCCLDCHTKKEGGFAVESHQEAINKAKEKFLWK